MPDEDTWKKGEQWKEGDEIWALSRQLDGRPYRVVVKKEVLSCLFCHHVTHALSTILVRKTDCFRTRAEAAHEGIRRAGEALSAAREKAQQIHAAAAAQIADADYDLTAATLHYEWLHECYSQEATSEVTTAPG